MNPITPQPSGETPPQREAITQRLIFRLGDVRLAIPVAEVREILNVGELMSLPQAPHHCLGLLQVRGESIAVIDFAQKIGMAPMHVDEHSRVVVLELTKGDQQKVLAILTDGVDGVADLESAGLENMPPVGEAWSNDFMESLGRYGDHTVILLNLSTIFENTDFHLN